MTDKGKIFMLKKQCFFVEFLKAFSCCFENIFTFAKMNKLFLNN